MHATIHQGFGIRVRIKGDIYYCYHDPLFLTASGMGFLYHIKTDGCFCSHANIGKRQGPAWEIKALSGDSDAHRCLVCF
jgi:hypothetical protein